MCFLMIFYAMNPHISYDVIVQREIMLNGEYGLGFWRNRLDTN